MKKIISIAIVSVIFILSLAGCTNTAVPNDIELYLEEGTLSSSGVTLFIKNNSDFYFTYGADYCIEKYKDGQWKQLPDPENYAVITIAYLLLPHSKSEKINFDWEWRYGKLPQGEYRIAKNFDKTETFEYNLDSIISRRTLYYYFTI